MCDEKERTMRILPAYFNPAAEKSSASPQYIPATSRRNPLADMEFNIIADTIRCQNLKKQMSIRLMNLKRSLNNSSGVNKLDKNV